MNFTIGYNNKDFLCQEGVIKTTKSLRHHFPEVCLLTKCLGNFPRIKNSFMYAGNISLYRVMIKEMIKQRSIQKLHDVRFGIFANTPPMENPFTRES